MSIIVLEGPECAGKSYIAGYLTAHYAPNVQVLKQGPPPVNDPKQIMAHYLKPLEAMIGRDDVHYVMDRWHVGELIYGPLLRGKSMLTGQQADYIDMVLQTFGARFHYVTAEIHTILERYDRRGDDLIERNLLPQIIFEYDEWSEGRPHWIWTYSDRWLTSKPRTHSPMAGRYIGPEKPSVLLLGDRRNDDRMIFPFVPERATSGHWLMGAMHEAGVDHMNVGILNACEITDDELFCQWVRLDEPPVITMGRNAEKQWKLAYGKTYAYLNHPQYERRFHYTAMRRYGQTIKDVMDSG